MPPLHLQFKSASWSAAGNETLGFSNKMLSGSPIIDGTVGHAIGGLHMDVKAFQYFEAVCRHRSISRAAAELGISPQGLTGSMARLSQDMGAPLLLTRDGVVEPTVYGKAVLARAVEINESQLAMRHEVAALVAHEQRVIRVGVITGALGYLGEGVIEEFNNRATDAHALVVCESTDGEVCRQLMESDVDIAILASKPDGSVRSSELVRDDYFIWANEKSRLSRLERISMADLEGETLALFDLEPKLSDPFVLAATKAGVRLMFVGELIRVFELAHEGRALGLTCRNHVDATRGTGVVGVPFDFLDLTYYLCYRLDRSLSPADDEFLRFLEGYRTVRGRRVYEVYR